MSPEAVFAAANTLVPLSWIALAVLPRRRLECRAAEDELAAAVAAAVVVATLETAVERWARERGRTPMRAVLEAAFRSLSRL